MKCPNDECGAVFTQPVVDEGSEPLTAHCPDCGQVFHAALLNPPLWMVAPISAGSTESAKKLGEKLLEALDPARMLGRAGEPGSACDEPNACREKNDAMRAKYEQRLDELKALAKIPEGSQ